MEKNKKKHSFKKYFARVQKFINKYLYNIHSLLSRNIAKKIAEHIGLMLYTSVCVYTLCYRLYILYIIIIIIIFMILMYMDFQIKLFVYA